MMRATSDTRSNPDRQTVIPYALKAAYTAFMAVLIPVYLWHYGPTNFLYFCDVALLMTLVGVWTERPLWVSMPAVGILVPQTVWVADFVANLFGAHLTGMTDYMFNAQSPLFLRGLSLFHGWLPFLLVYLVWRLGYDRRALIAWTGMAWGLLAVSYFAMPGPMADRGLMPVNINYVYGFSDAVAQTWMPGWAWFSMLMVGLPVVMFWPVHLVLSRFLGQAAVTA